MHLDCRYNFFVRVISGTRQWRSAAAGGGGRGRRRWWWRGRDAEGGGGGGHVVFSLQLVLVDVCKVAEVAAAATWQC